MTVLAIDPGPKHSAYVLWGTHGIEAHGKLPNDDLLRILGVSLEFDTVVLEQVASYGMAVGAEVFETVFWTGRFFEAVTERCMPMRVVRQAVKLHLCHDTRAKDSNIRQALIDRFGGKEKAIGRKASPGPLYGIKADCWQALALAIVFHDQQGGSPSSEEGR